MNLGFDNFIGNSLDLIRTLLVCDVKVIHLWSGIPGDGTCGRSVIARDVFYTLGGHDESFYPADHEDIDLLKRARKSGISVEHCPCVADSALKNTKEEGMRYYSLKKGMTWKECVRSNRQASDRNILVKRLTANRDTE